MKITGQILKENREKKGISLSEVSLATKINTRTIIAMEQGDMDNLPPKTFLRGFVQTYAHFLQLNVDEILNTFMEEMGSTKPVLKAPPNNRKPGEAGGAASVTAKSNLIMKSLVMTGIALLVGLILYFKDKMARYESEEIIPVYDVSLESLPASAPSPPASPAAATTTPTPTPGPSPAPTATPGMSPAPTATPAPEATATPAPSPTPTPGPTATPQPAPTAATENASARPQEVIIEAFDRVDVEARIDNEAPRKITLRTDQVQTFKAKQKIILTFSDGGAVNVIVNGVERGVPGDLGKSKRIELP